jgi:hypothetical protein
VATGKEPDANLPARPVTEADEADEADKKADEVRRRAQELIEEIHDRDPHKTKTIRGTS